MHTLAIEPVRAHNPKEADMGTTPRTAQKFRQNNIDAIVSYFASGIKEAGSPGKLGIEVEHFILNEDDSSVQYHESQGVDWLLEQLSETYPDRTFGTHGELIGVAKEGVTVTLEPGAQVELSAGPYSDLGGIQTDFEDFLSCVTRIISPSGKKIATYGYRPAGKALDVALIPKTRYNLMDHYFERIGPYGARMMRGSAATQISIDYFSVGDCTRKLKIASACAPLFSLLCDNTPFFENEPRTHAMMRSDVWRYCDPDRSGTIPGIMSDTFTLEDYANYLLDIPAILVPDKATFRACDRTFGEEYADRTMTRTEVEHALSMHFTDVRLKTYIEIRPADSLPPVYVASYAALVKALFYNDSALEQLGDWCRAIDDADITAAKASLAEHGFDGIAYGATASDQLRKLFALAEQNLSQHELKFLEPLREVARTRTTLADRFERQRAC